METKKNVEVNVSETKTSNSLMKKTKVQLVEIILRKDKVEQNLKKDIEGTVQTFNDYVTENERKIKQLNDDIKNRICHINNLKDEILKKNIKINRLKTFNATIIMFLIIAIVYEIIRFIY